MSGEITRSAAVIAEEINNIKSQTSGILTAALAYTKRSCFEIGKRLVEAKELVPFGEWGEWLESNFEYSESTAGNLMRIYREFGSEQVDMLTGKSPAELFEGLSQSQLVELFTLPKGARADFVEEYREELVSGEMSIREMRALIEKQKATIERQEKDILDNDDSFGKLVMEKKAVEERCETLAKSLEKKQIEIEGLREQTTEQVIKTVYEPSKEQIKEIKAEAVSKTEKKYQADIERLTKELKSKDAERDEALKAAEAESLKKIRQLTQNADPHAGRIAYCMESVSRALADINKEISQMEEETPGSGTKMRMRLEANLISLLNKFGWQV